MPRCRSGSRNGLCPSRSSARESRTTGTTPPRAKNPLAEAGFPNGFPATISYATYGSTIVMDQLQLILKYLKDVGIDAKPNQQEYGAYISTTFYGKYESMAFGPQTPFLDPDNFLYGPNIANELKNQGDINHTVRTTLHLV